MLAPWPVGGTPVAPRQVQLHGTPRGAAAGPAAAALARLQAQRCSRAACYFGPATGLFLESAEHPFSQTAPPGMTLRSCSLSLPAPPPLSLGSVTHRPQGPHSVQTPVAAASLRRDSGVRKEGAEG